MRERRPIVWLVPHHPTFGFFLPGSPVPLLFAPGFCFPLSESNNKFGILADFVSGISLCVASSFEPCYLSIGGSRNRLIVSFLVI